MSHVRVIVVDDHQVFSELLARALDAEPGVRCVATARTAQVAEGLAAQVGFDAAIIDVQLPDGDGVDLIARMRRQRPEALYALLTAYPTAELTSRAEQEGVALLTKDGSLRTVLGALQDAPQGPEAPMLTARESEVIELLAAGLDPSTVARTLGVSVHTAREHVKSILRKTGSRSQLEAVATARRSGLLGSVA